MTTGQNGILDMDQDVSWDGTQMVVSRAHFSGGPLPDASRLVLFGVSSRIAFSIPGGESLLSKVNLSACRVYAGSLSRDGNELYYTLIPASAQSPSDFRIAVSKRA